MRKAYKYIVSLSVVLIAGLNIVVPAFAQDPFTGIAIGGIGGASGAGLFGSMASMSGIDISYTSDPVNDAMWNKLNSDSVYFSGEKHEATGSDEDVWDYITVDIGDWLSAQSDFIVNFAQTNNVQDNDTGTVTTNNHYKGYPFDSTTGLGPILGTVGIGNIQYSDLMLIFTDFSSTYLQATAYYNGNQVAQNTVNKNYIGYNVCLNGGGTNITWVIPVPPSSMSTICVAGVRKQSGTNINWTSGNVNTSVFDGWNKAKVKIPHNLSGLTPGWTIPDFTNAINNLWSQNLQGQIVIEDTDQPIPPPTPTPTPLPDTQLGQVPFDDWVDLWGQGIWQQLETQNDALDFIGSNGEDAVEELESIDSNLEDLTGTAESIDTNIGVGNGLLGGIKSGVESAVDFLEGIAEHVGELVEEIVEGTETLIAGILNQIPSVFGVIFGPIKQASSIWHYVVEWIQSISAPMSWIWSMASGTSYNIILPVYASLAGAVVLAFYKRFGK